MTTDHKPERPVLDAKIPVRTTQALVDRIAALAENWTPPQKTSAIIRLALELGVGMLEKTPQEPGPKRCDMNIRLLLAGKEQFRVYVGSSFVQNWDFDSGRFPYNVTVDRLEITPPR